MPTRSPADVPMRRLAVIAVALFVVILALLAGRVQAGADPAQPTAAATPTPQTTVQDPYRDPYGSEPIPGGPSDFGGDERAAPDDGSQGAAPDGGVSPDDGSQGATPDGGVSPDDGSQGATPDGGVAPPTQAS